MASAKGPTKGGRARRYARRAAIGVAGLLAFLALAVVGVLFSLRFAAVRQLVVTRVNGALAGSFQGRIQVHGLQRVGLGGIGAADAEVFDPAGRRVLDVHGLDVRLSVPTIVWAVLAHKSQPLTIRLDSVTVKHAEVLLVDDGQGAPTLADTFLPKTPSAPSSGPGTIVVIGRAQLDHVWAHGALASTPPLDVELKDVLGALRMDAIATTLSIQRAGVKARGLPAGVDPLGQLNASLTIPAAPEKPLGARAHYQGTAANVPLVLDASYLDSRLVADVQAKRIPPEALAKQVPGLVLRSPASLTVHAQGKLPELHGSFALGVGSGKAEGDFQLSLTNDTLAKATVRTHDLDLAELTPSGPVSNLDLTLHAGVTVPHQGAITGDFSLDTEPSVVLAETLPPVAITGTFSSDPQSKRNRVEAHGQIAEPGAASSVDATMEQGQQTTVEFKTTTKLQNPPRLRKLAAVKCVQGELSIQGSYRVEDSSLNAQVRGALRDIEQGANQIKRVNLSASVAGALPHPNADVRLDVTDAELAGQHITTAQVAARGSLSHVALSAEVVTRAPERHVQVSALASTDHGISLDHPSLNLRQDETNLKLSADRVEVANGRTRVSAFHVEGAGKADATLVYGPNLESVNLQSYDLDLAKIWRLFDPRAPLKSGTATIGMSYERRGASPRARITLRSQDLSFNRVNGGSLQAELNLDQGVLDGSAHADLKRLGRLSFDFQGVRGINLDHFDPTRITGKIAIEGEVKLKDVNALVPKDVDSPIARALGTVKYDLAIDREHAGPGLPTLHAHIRTKKLQLAAVRKSQSNLETIEEAKAAAPLSVKGLDIDVDVRHAESGETELAGTLTDEHGQLAALSVEGKATPHLATIADELVAQWRQIPLNLKLTVPPRELQQLPVEIRPAALSGVISGEFSYEGTLSAPNLKLSGKVDRFRQDATKKDGLGLAWTGSYDGTRGKFDADARAGNKDVAKVDIDFHTAINAWLNQTGEASPALDASAHLDFDSFPIALIPGTASSEVDGALTGKVAVEHFGTDATVESSLDVASLTIGQSPFGRIHAEAKAANGRGDVTVRVEGKKGTTTAEGHSGLLWGSRYVPQLQLPADAQLRARELQIGAFSPFLASTFGELNGRLNGDLNAHFRGGAPELDGHVDFDDGVAQVAAVGQRFDQIKARVTLQAGKATLEELTARATSGKLKVTGEARFAGLSLTGADAHLRIAKSDKVALSVSGNDIGDMYGAIDMTLRPNPTTHANTLGVTISSLNVHLPDTGGQDVQDLAPAKGVRIGTRQERGGFVTLPLQPLMDSDPSKNDAPMIVDLNLGSQLNVERGDTTKVQLGGNLRLVMGDPTTMNGIIQLRGGRLDVSGKQFEVDSGSVTFAGDPSNPTIVASASWDSGDADKHRVTAAFSGTMKKGKLDLRSEPPLTQDEILSLLLTGSSDGSLGGGSTGGGNAATAVGAVGGAATQGLNRALSNISNLDVSTRVDTSSGSARPELVIQISPRVAAQITRALGEPPPGAPPDLTFLTFDFRVLSHWSVAALIGDRGESGLDLVWRKRY
ncbi:MAG: translocation/assembly module TamB domain-containing protein [Polyangiaceae bacterium]